MDWSAVDYCDVFIRLSFWRHPFTSEHPLTLILTAPIHCRASIDSHSDGTHSLQSIHWLSFWRHPFTSEHPLTLILTAPIHCRASIDSHSDGTHSLQSIHWLSFWRHPFTAVHPLTLILTAPIHCSASIAETLMQRHISPNLMKKQTHLHHFQHIFGLNYSSNAWNDVEVVCDHEAVKYVSGCIGALALHYCTIICGVAAARLQLDRSDPQSSGRFISLCHDDQD